MNADGASDTTQLFALSSSSMLWYRPPTYSKIAARRLDFLQYEVVARIPSLTDQVKLAIMNV